MPLVRMDCINGFMGAFRRDDGKTVMDWINQNRSQRLVVVGICNYICVTDMVPAKFSARNHGMMPTLETIFVYADGWSTYGLRRGVAVRLGLIKRRLVPRTNPLLGTIFHGVATRSTGRQLGGETRLVVQKNGRNE